MPLHTHSENCQQVFAVLSDYLNLELPPDACAEIEAHIAGCTPCVEFAESLRKTVAMCKQYQPAELPAPLGAAAKAQLVAAYGKMLAARKSG